MFYRDIVDPTQRVATATATFIPSLFDKRQHRRQCDPRTGGVDQDSCDIAWLQIPTTNVVEFWTTGQSLAVPDFLEGGIMENGGKGGRRRKGVIEMLQVGVESKGSRYRVGLGGPGNML